MVCVFLRIVLRLCRIVLDIWILFNVLGCFVYFFVLLISVSMLRCICWLLKSCGSFDRLFFVVFLVRCMKVCIKFLLFFLVFFSFLLRLMLNFENLLIVFWLKILLKMFCVLVVVFLVVFVCDWIVWRMVSSCFRLFLFV